MTEPGQAINCFDKLLEMAKLGNAVEGVINSHRSKYISESNMEILKSLFTERDQIIDVLYHYSGDIKGSTSPYSSLLRSLKEVLLNISGLDKQFPEWKKRMTYIRSLDPSAETAIYDRSYWKVRTSLYIIYNGSSRHADSGLKPAKTEPEAIYDLWNSLTQIRDDEYISISEYNNDPVYKWDGTLWANVSRVYMERKKLF